MAKINILIFFMTSLFLIGGVSAELISDTWQVDSSTVNTLIHDSGTEYTQYYWGMGTFTLGDADQLRSMYFYGITIPNDKLATTKDSDYKDVVFKIGDTTVGYGVAGYNNGSENTYIQYWMQEWDISAYSGSQVITVVGVPTTINCDWNYNVDLPAPTGQEVYLRTYYDPRSEYYSWAYATHTVQMRYSFTNTISVDFDDLQTTISFERDAPNSSMFNVSQNSVQILYEGTLVPEDTDIYSNITNPITITGINLYGDSYYKVFTSSLSPPATGTITLDKTFYTDPDNITVTYSMSGTDFINKKYRILFYEDVNKDGSSWREILAMDYNESRILSTSSGSLLADLQSDHYFLPIGFKVKLVETTLDTYTSITLDETEIVQYGPAVTFDYLVQGVVYDAYSSNPISTARVNFTAGTALETYDYTSSIGGYRVGLLGGFYEVTVTKAGYETYSESHYIDENQTLNIPLTATTATDGEVYGIVTDAETSLPVGSATIQVYNSTGFLEVDYSTDSGYYSILGLTNDSTYTIKVIRRDYFVYLEDFMTETSGSTLHNVQLVTSEGAATPTVTATYPGGSGVAWTNDDITTMLRVTIPGIFMIILIMLLMAVLTGSGGSPRNPGPGMFETINRSYRRR